MGWWSLLRLDGAGRPAFVLGIDTPSGLGLWPLMPDWVCPVCYAPSLPALLPSPEMKTSACLHLPLLGKGHSICADPVLAAPGAGAFMVSLAPLLMPFIT